MNYFVELLLNIAICIPISLFEFYFVFGGDIYVAEHKYMKFRIPLREGYPKEYFKQNKLIKYIRKRLKLSTYDTLHYSIIILHYVQLVFTFIPFCLCLLGFSVFELKSLSTFFVVLVIANGIFLFILSIHLTIKEFRCRKIKKTNPKYSKYDVQERWGHW